jgi:sulfatase modifying factor 1
MFRTLCFGLLGGMLLLPAQAAPPQSARTLRLPGDVKLELAWIPAGTFVMGSPAAESGRRADENPQTTVTLSRGFWLGRTHVTIAQWRSVMGVGLRGQLVKMIEDEEPHDLGGKLQTRREYMGFSPGQVDDYLAGEADDLPMYFVSWEDAMEFCRRLSALERAAGRLPEGYEYDLPSEAQWEYAARAGSREANYQTLDAIAWYDANSAQGYAGKGFKVAGGANGGPHAVGLKSPNHWGLYDTAGNVWQWCRDWYAPYSGGKLVDPAGPPSGTLRVNRGGSFGSSARDERSASRAANPPMEASAYRGFRLALVARQPTRNAYSSRMPTDTESPTY